MSTFRSSFIGECWQKMKIMKAEFEQSESGDGLQSRKAREERVRDEQASSRMDDEGCPNPRQQPDSRKRKHTIPFATILKEGTPCVAIDEELGVLDHI